MLHDKPTAHKILAAAAFQPWNLMGPRNKKLRQDLIVALIGEKRPLAKCGVTEIQRILNEKIDTSGATSDYAYPWYYKAYFDGSDPTNRDHISSEIIP